MLEIDKNNNFEDLDITVKMAFNPDNVELTQKINVDYDKVIEDSKKQVAIIKKNEPQESSTSSLLGKSIFNKKRIADDYVKSSTIISTIDSIQPLKDKLELQDVKSNYELKKQFSEGAQGIIRTAFDKSLKRDIVVKSLKFEEDDEFARHDEHFFVSEARIMAQLD
ncbi:MAG: hypothetical protein KOO69_00855, partial [Victivallales bacterium]|nr:hypothetical protein [Victivallales bacterium]